MSFGENVRREREAMNMTQEQLGEAVGVSLQMISYIERERRNTDIYLARDIARALKKSLDFLADNVDCA